MDGRNGAIVGDGLKEVGKNGSLVGVGRWWYLVVVVVGLGKEKNKALSS